MNKDKGFTFECFLDDYEHFQAPVNISCKERNGPLSKTHQQKIDKQSERLTRKEGLKLLKRG